MCLAALIFGNIFCGHEISSEKMLRKARERSHKNSVNHLFIFGKRYFGYRQAHIQARKSQENLIF
jgi:hypothetical protein